MQLVRTKILIGAKKRVDFNVVLLKTGQTNQNRYGTNYNARIKAHLKFMYTKAKAYRWFRTLTY